RRGEWAGPRTCSWWSEAWARLRSCATFASRSGSAMSARCRYRAAAGAASPSTTSTPDRVAERKGTGNVKEKFNRFRAWGGGWFLAGVVILGIGIAIDVRVQSSFPEWSMVLVAFVPMSLLAVGIDKASKEWDAGREERRKKRSVERTVAVVGYYVWLIPSVLMVVGLIGVTLAGTSRISGVLALFGGIWLFIAGVMGGKPSMKKGLEPLPLNKRIMNWQLAVSAAIASPLLGAAISNQKDLLSPAGTNWGYP